MKHISGFDSAPQGCCVAFGSFDGLHLGHRAVIEVLTADKAMPAVLISFSEEKDPIIYTENEKAYLLEDSGIDTIVSMPRMDAEAMTPEAFAKHILSGRLNAKKVILGEGHKDAKTYKALGKELGFEVVTVSTVMDNGEEVTTDLLKACIEKGDFVRFRKLLGRTYIMQGTVVHGKAAGRKHGMPTANLGVAKNKLFPPYGVYGTLTHLDGKAYQGMTNIGLRPSDDDIPIATIETFILNFSGDIYDKPLTLEVFLYVRGTVKFANLDEVRKQIDKDIEQIKDYMEEVMRTDEN